MIRYLKDAILAPILEYWTVILGCILLIVGGFFFLQVASIQNLTDFFVLLLLPFGIVAGYMLYRSIYENVSENTFGNTLSALVPIVLGIFSVVYVQGKAWSTSSVDEQTSILYLILSSLLWIAGVHLIFQTYTLGSGAAIKLLIRELQYSERQKLDWLQEGKTDYTVEVFKMARIPYDISSINKDAESPQIIQKVLNKYFSHRGKSDKQRVLILVGSFGTGKSTALVNSVIRQLKNIFHGSAIPIYVKLRDCIRQEDIDNRQISSDVLSNKFFDNICRQYNSSDNETLLASFKETLYTFHQGRKIVYVFDGLNEILQMTQSSKNKEAEAQRLVNFLYTFSAGNDCIISFYPMPGIISSQSLSIDNPGRKYEMYGIYGISEAKKVKREAQINKSISASIPESVALFRMYEMLNKQEKDSLPAYDLIQSTLEARLDSLIAGSTKEMEKLEDLVNSHFFNFSADFSTPYSSLPGIADTDYSELCDMRILQSVSNEEENNTQREVQEYTFCHILILEYFVARCVLKKLSANSLDGEDIVIIRKILKNGSNDYFSHIHIVETNRLIIEKLQKNKNEEAINKLLTCLLFRHDKDSFKQESDLQYLEFLLNVGIDASVLKNYITNGNPNEISEYIKTDIVKEFKNEKLKIALMKLTETPFNIESEITNWNSSFVALKRDFYKRYNN